jgi:large subunit ribosomal protein L25
MYGPGTTAQAIQLNTREATRVFRFVHGAELIDLEVEGETRKVLVHDLQRDTIRGDLLHADFYVVDMARPIRLHLPIRLVGNSPAVVSLSGVLVRGIAELEIECLPGDLITSVDADLVALKEIGSAIHVRDLALPKTIKVLTDPDEQVARVTFQAKEEDLSTPAGATASEVEVIEKGKIEAEGEEEGKEAKPGQAKVAPGAQAKVAPGAQAKAVPGAQAKTVTGARDKK